MKMGHVRKADLSRFRRGSDPRTVNTQTGWTVPAHHGKQQIRLVKPAQILKAASPSPLHRDELSRWSFYRRNQDSQARTPPAPPSVEGPIMPGSSIVLRCSQNHRDGFKKGRETWDGGPQPEFSPRLILTSNPPINSGVGAEREGNFSGGKMPRSP